MIRASQPVLVMIVGLAAAMAGCSPNQPEKDLIAEAVACAEDDECAVGSICEAGSCEPAVCPDIYDPVCASNGTTYENACDARAEHATVAHPGECEQVCGGVEALPCPDSELCDLAARACDGIDVQGVCVERPEACAEIFEPVCGCDGTTYSNDCFRLMAGVQLDHTGECRA